MILNDTRLYLDVDEFDRVQCSEFLFNSCYVSNYLSRHARAMRWNSEAYKGVLIKCTSKGDVLPHLSPQRNLIVPIEFDHEKYDHLTGVDLHELYLSLFCNGFEKAALHFQFPIFELLSIIKRFRTGGYKNEWVFKRKKFGDISLQCSLFCEINRKKFTLFLCVENECGTLFQEKILETKPDELIFSHKFKDLGLQDNKIVVLDKFANSIFELPIYGLE
jgi:hypothetical protein